jgi:hypothetical protein
MNALMARRNTRLPAMMAKNNLSKRSTPKHTTLESIRRFWVCRFFDTRQAKVRQVVGHQGSRATFSKCYRRWRIAMCGESRSDV